MKNSRQFKGLVQTTFAAVMVTLASGWLAPALFAADTKPDGPPPKTDSTASPTNSAAANIRTPDPAKAIVKKRLTGAELYSMHCNRCHPERYPTERTAAQWKTIMLHMQVRASIPADQAKLILDYLQQNSGR